MHVIIVLRNVDDFAIPVQVMCLDKKPLPVIPRVLFGIPYLNVIVLFGGIALASDEFFRTEAKGKERKYSYTGIFVGIMIAGIGLMSAL